VDGIYYVLSLIAFWIIVRWFVQNDRRAAGERTIGLLCMSDGDVVDGNEPRDQPLAKQADAPLAGN
jgi:hypothetical protein